MQIHSFYSDLLLSTRHLFDNYIFKTADYIQKYEFNYGNRAFQLDSDYKQNFKFPVLMVNLGNVNSSYGQRTENLQPIKTTTENQIPVLYNRTNEQYLYVQEEQSNINISIVINCESQFQAREIEHVINRFLPLNKYIGILKFTSFLEVSQEYISKDLFHFQEHDIVNHYERLNRNTGNVDHFFSIQYEPLIKNESISTTIADSNQRSFQVNLDLNYLIQLPIFVFNDKDNFIDSIHVNYGNYGYESIADYPVQKIINNDTQLDLHLKTIKHQLLFHDEDIIEHHEGLTRIKLQPNKKSIELKDYWSYNFICNGKIHKDMPFIFHYEEDVNRVDFEMPTTVFEDKFKIAFDKPLVIQIIEPVASQRKAPGVWERLNDLPLLD